MSKDDAPMRRFAPTSPSGRLAAWLLVVFLVLFAAGLATLALSDRPGRTDDPFWHTVSVALSWTGLAAAVAGGAFGFKAIRTENEQSPLAYLAMVVGVLALVLVTVELFLIE